MHILTYTKPLESKSVHNTLWKECVSVFERLTEPLVRRSGSFVYPGAWGGSGVCFVLRDDWRWSSFISLQPFCLWGPPDGLYTSWDLLEFSQVWGLSGKAYINTPHCRRWQLPGRILPLDHFPQQSVLLISYPRLLCFSRPVLLRGTPEHTQTEPQHTLNSLATFEALLWLQSTCLQL